MSDSLTSLLDRAPLTAAQRAGLWDLYQAAKNEDDLDARLKSLKLPKELKADLWDLKFSERAPEPTEPPKAHGPFKVTVGMGPQMMPPVGEIGAEPSEIAKIVELGEGMAAPDSLGDVASLALPAVGPKILAGATKTIGDVATATGTAVERGADVLRALLGLKGGWKAGIAKVVVPPIMRAGGQALSKTGQALSGPTTREALSERLRRIPIAGRLEQIGEQVADDVPKFAADTAQVLADDVALIRESISKGMDPKVAIRIIANGSADYADALKDAYVATVKTQGLPPPQAVLDLLKSKSFARLAKP